MPDHSDRAPLLDVEGLSVEYRGSSGSKCVAVSSASFQLNAGEIVGIFGESGSGKTTLGLSLLNLLPDSAVRTAIKMLFRGRDLLSLSPSEVRRIRGNEISIMYQEPALALHPMLRVGDQIAEVIRAHKKTSRQQRRERVWELLRHVRLDRRKGIYEAYPHELSGGERHRIVIAQALACSPALVIADEPTAGLDLALKFEIADLIAQLRSDLGVSFLVISHDRALLGRIANRTLEMSAGRLREAVIVRESLVAQRSAPLHPKQSSTEPLISIRGLNKSYNKRGVLFRSQAAAQVLSNVNLTIAPGSTLALVGPSGSGKSTLARCLAMWERPDEGEIVFAGRDLAAASRDDVRRIAPEIQLVLQDSAAAFNPNFTAEQVVEEPLLIRGVAQAERKSRVRQMIEEVGLGPEVLSKKQLEFSGGQRQRLAIARALVLNPKLIVFDESTTGLDRETLQQIIALLLQLKASRNLTYLVISHDLDVISAMADRVATMDRGTVINVASAADWLRDVKSAIVERPPADAEPTLAAVMEGK